MRPFVDIKPIKKTVMFQKHGQLKLDKANRFPSRAYMRDYFETNLRVKNIKLANVDGFKEEVQ